MSRLRLFAALFLVLFGVVGLARTGSAQQAGPTPASVARMTFHHGIPYALGHGLGPQAVPELLAMLERTEERPYWANVIRILGMIGDARAVPGLIAFVETRLTGEVDAETFQALIQVNQSLGLLANDPASVAFDYLSRAASLSAWRSKQLRWTFPSLRGEEREILMLKLTINGLGNAGNARSAARLTELQRDLSADTALFPYVRGNLSDALLLNERIQRDGYARVFQ